MVLRLSKGTFDCQIFQITSSDFPEAVKHGVPVSVREHDHPERGLASRRTWEAGRAGRQMVAPFSYASSHL